MKGADSYKKVLDHIVRCTWRPNKELTEKIDDYEVIIVDVIPDITAALYHSDCDDIPYNGDVLADILASSSFGTFVGLLNKDSHKFEHANFYQLKHVESKDNQFKTKVDLVAKKASERKEIIVDPQHV